MPLARPEPLRSYCRVESSRFSFSSSWLIRRCTASSGRGCADGCTGAASADWLLLLVPLLPARRSACCALLRWIASRAASSRLSTTYSYSLRSVKWSSVSMSSSISSSSSFRSGYADLIIISATRRRFGSSSSIRPLSARFWSSVSSSDSMLPRRRRPRPRPEPPVGGALYRASSIPANSSRVMPAAAPRAPRPRDPRRLPGVPRPRPEPATPMGAVDEIGDVAFEPTRRCDIEVGGADRGGGGDRVADRAEPTLGRRGVPPLTPPYDGRRFVPSDRFSSSSCRAMLCTLSSRLRISSVCDDWLRASMSISSSRVYTCLSNSSSPPTGGECDREKGLRMCNGRAATDRERGRERRWCACRRVRRR
ncbi:hypothetical protein DL89DRAFT_51879 [Linderina pennispora]|uniref:Uncharacterized protein n=1 Tax=Linderina pennispora TaxID=61395 RepID=A0A1Y1W1U9_9FUNG|nr:uncharacterized protein DL89DRAFT_51879 [Linderina pennispora]ORX67094.1 hypothetical protein DL89DRAFT_51879 [Linderina pennispora]